MGWLVLAMLLFGGLFYGISRTKMFDGLDKSFAKGLGLGLIILGLLIGFSSLYVNHAPWFWVPALLAGGLLLGLHFNTAGLLAFNGKQFWGGAGLLVAGVVMLILEKVAFVMLVLAGIGVFVYWRFSKDTRLRQAADSLRKEVEGKFRDLTKGL